MTEHFKEIDRLLGKQCLGKYLQSQKNVEIIEKNIFNISDTEKDYKTNIYNVINDLISGIELKHILNNLKQKKVIFNMEKFDNIKFSILEQQKFLEKPFEVEEGVLQCNKCGSKRTFSFSKQTRGGDEGTTVFAQCAECGARWKM